MRFYVPEWDDAVDAHYDFEHDELSSLNRQERELDYIWDIFERDTTPIDGVLISREQVEETDRKADRLAEFGVYDDPVLSVPEWLPTISDCGAWGYKSLPFPPYGNAEMLDFYEKLKVTVGVTIDHLVLGSGKDKGRLYLNNHAFHEDPIGFRKTIDEEYDRSGDERLARFRGNDQDGYEGIKQAIYEETKQIIYEVHNPGDDGFEHIEKWFNRSEGPFEQSDLPDTLTDVVDIMAENWPEEWPDYVDEYQPSIRTGDADVLPFYPELFWDDIDTVLKRLAQDPRAVYRADDKQFRYDLTLRNAREMYDLYESGDYPFRLMVAIQGWNPEVYAEAADEVLNLGYDYLGIGGVAGSPIHDVRQIVKGVGKTVKDFERECNTRIDTHVFGFAKTEGFETIGRSGMTSFDSASMLRSAWTGGQNYRLDADERYDAIRVRYPSNRDTLAEAIDKSLRGRETLVALRAYANGDSIVEALEAWHSKAEPVLSATRDYFREHRHDDQYDASLLRDIESAFRADFGHARELQASFSDQLRSKLIKLLRDDEPEDSLDFREYEVLLSTAEDEFQRFPRMVSELEELCDATPYDEVWAVVRDYTAFIGDEDLLEEYQRTLRNRPWERCDCPICTANGIEVCIFRGNDRNRRRGFHNTRRFYDEFTDELPKILVATRGTAALGRYDTVEEYLREKHPSFWQQVHDLPVAEVGVLDADGVQEWWQDTPSSVSFSPTQMAANLSEQAKRYQRFYVQTPNGKLHEGVVDAVEQTGCTVETFEHPGELREATLDSCGEHYAVDTDFVPHPPKLATNRGLNILVIDQCSGSKDIPSNAPVFEAEEIDQSTRKELLNRENVPGIAARDLYTGRQQGFVTEAIRRLKSQGHTVNRHFISAGFGLVPEDQKLPPYEVTFSSMNVGEIRERSATLQIKEDLQWVLDETEYDIVFFTLGQDYYTSIDIDEIVQQIRPDRIGVVFNREIVDEQFDNIVSVPARTADAKEHGTIVVGLKGVYLKNFARRLGDIDLLEPQMIEELCRRIEKEPKQAAFEKY